MNHFAPFQAAGLASMLMRDARLQAMPIHTDDESGLPVGAMPNRFDVRGQVAVVTGGAAGLGAASARALADHIAVVAVLDLDHDSAEARTQGFPAGSFGRGCDVSSPERSRHRQSRDPGI